MDKKVIVTGAAGGLGAEIVKKHLVEGDYVWALDLSMNDRIREMLENDAETHHLHFSECDISLTESTNSAIDKVLRTYDYVDYIYNCAGIIRSQDRVPLTSTDLDAISSVVNINAVGFLRVIKAVFRLITKKTAIICITSEAGSIGENHRSQEYSYAMSKCAENMACVILQKYLDDEINGARVECLHPGWMKTQMGGGDTAAVDPSVSAEAIIRIAKEIDEISREEMFIDYLRKPLHW